MCLVEEIYPSTILKHSSPVSTLIQSLKELGKTRGSMSLYRSPELLASWFQEFDYKDLCRGPLDNVTYQIYKLWASWFQRRSFYIITYKSM